MNSPATAPTTATVEPAEDPRDRRRRAAATICALLGGLGVGVVIGAANRENVGDNAVIIAINAASILLLWTLITLSTSAAVKQLIETILAKFRAIVADSQTWCLQVLRDAVREEIKEQIAEPTREVAGRMGRIQDRLGVRPDDDPDATKPIVYQLPPPQHTIGVAPVHGSARMDAAVDRAMDRFTAHVDGLIRKFDEHVDGCLADVEKLAETQPALNGRGTVVGWPLKPRP
ncbi:hypothetical protein [Phytohabitans houttuyneae]|uniref:Uncharacterized protein n=1 Tax=Phytohabitans houttuyneae TaxID=1076126 RepID=A0A6V8KAI7_9ACTN|nr:hypothetical protein [Phytohabitans houttuyneae]GFJ79398.1 hypothetical protein Phou_035780 [Phytohabitans houttuyneae]